MPLMFTLNRFDGNICAKVRSGEGIREDWRFGKKKFCVAIYMGLENLEIDRKRRDK